MTSSTSHILLTFKTQSCRNLESLLSALHVYLSDPDFYINDVISELRNRVEIKREEAKLRIDHEAEKAIDELHLYEQECKSNAHRDDGRIKAASERLQKSLVAIKEELDQWLEQLSRSNDATTITADEVKGEDIWVKIKVKSEKRMAMIAREIEMLKGELMMNRLNEFDYISDFKENKEEKVKLESIITEPKYSVRYTFKSHS